MPDNYEYKLPAVSVIIPVVDEKLEVWIKTLGCISQACASVEHQILVIANGKHSEQNAIVAKEQGFAVVRIPAASKRLAIEAGVDLVRYPITIILDSDTFATPDSVKKLLLSFYDERVGGATPKHEIFDRQPVMRRVSAWFEDIRFNEVLRGQSVAGAVSCLPGRMFAIRTHLLKQFAPDLARQEFLGVRCCSGDDRYLTSRILQEGYKTIYQPDSLVYTDAPDTLKGFMMQRLRWSRTSMREAIRSIPWTINHPYMTFTVFANVIMRWFFFVVLVHAVLVWTGFVTRSHFVWQVFPRLHTPLFMLLGVALGFLISGFLKQLRHLIHYPQDILCLPAFLLITTFVLTPVEWFGNLTVTEKGWMTRRV
jgi:cellulose synthase/poly-beta-1,6-N-acetylglucosamine synthase-like glycosyltransferase